MVIRHNHLQNIFMEFCRHAHLSVRVEAGRGLLGVNSNSRPADVLVDVWERAKPVAFDLTVTSHTPATLGDCKNQQDLQLMQELQLIQLSVGSTLPMTQSVRSWGGSVFPLLLKDTAIGVKRSKTPSHNWHLSFQSANAARSLRSFQRPTVGSISL